VEDQATELARLRDLAYSRSGTDDDRRRLAELEAERASETAIGGTRDAPARPPRRVVALAAAVGAVIGAVIATAVTLAVVGSPQPEPEVSAGGSALAVFDRDAGSIDDVSNLKMPLDQLLVDYRGSLIDGADDLALRWVGAPSGHDVYAVRWSDDEGVHVCLIVEAQDGAQRGCISEDEFRAEGIRMSAYGLELKWGPTGTEVWATGLR
jgi:hypothetical protein